MNIRMLLIAIGRFTHDEISLWRRLLWIKIDRMLPSEIAGEENSDGVPVIESLLHDYGTGAKNMSRVRILERNVVRQDLLIVSLLNVEEAERLLRVRIGVERHGRLVTRVVMAVNGLRVFHLQVGAITQDELRHFMRRRGAPDLPAKPAGDELWQIPRVVQMRVREHDVRNVRDLDRQRLPVHLAQFAPALEETGIKQQTPMRRRCKKT